MPLKGIFGGKRKTENALNRPTDKTGIRKNSENGIRIADLSVSSSKERFKKNRSSNENDEIIHPRICMYVFIGLVACEAAVNFDSGVIPAVLDVITVKYSMTNTQLGVLGALPYIGLIVASPFFGRILISYPAKKLLFISLLCNLISTVILASSVHVSMLFISRFCIGVTQAPVIIYAPVWVDEFAPRSKLTLWMGLTQAGSAGGIMLGYLCGGFLKYKDWRYSVVIQCGILSIITSFLLVIPCRYINTYYPVTFSGRIMSRRFSDCGRRLSFTQDGLLISESNNNTYNRSWSTNNIIEPFNADNECDTSHKLRFKDVIHSTISPISHDSEHSTVFVSKLEKKNLVRKKSNFPSIKDRCLYKSDHSKSTLPSISPITLSSRNDDIHLECKIDTKIGKEENSFELHMMHPYERRFCESHDYTLNHTLYTTKVISETTQSLEEQQPQEQVETKNVGNPSPFKSPQGGKITTLSRNHTSHNIHRPMRFPSAAEFRPLDMPHRKCRSASYPMIRRSPRSTINHVQIFKTFTNYWNNRQTVYVRPESVLFKIYPVVPLGIPFASCFMCIKDQHENTIKDSSPLRGKRRLFCCQNLLLLLKSPLYVLLTLTLCSLYYVVTGIQFWATLFFEIDFEVF